MSTARRLGRFNEALVYTTAILAGVVFDYATKPLQNAPYRPGDPWYRSVWKADFWYERALFTASQLSNAERVAVVTITAGVEPKQWMLDECQNRKGMGQIIEAVSKLGAAAVVVDVWYPPPDPDGDCKADGTGKTPHDYLKESIAAVSARVPVIIARDSVDQDELDFYCHQKGIEITEDIDDILRPSADFSGVAGKAGVLLGLVRMNTDTRRLPLAFWSYESCDAAAARASRKIALTLSGATATALRLFDESRERVQEPGRHPLIHMLRPAAFPVFHAIDVVCAAGQHPECRDRPRPEGDLAFLRGRAVLIGALTDRDRHFTPAGRLPGAFLQANYLESVLQGRFFRQASTWAEALLSLLWLFTITMIFKSRRMGPELALVLSLAATLALNVIAVPLLMLYTKVYYGVMVPSLLLVAARYVGARLRRLETSDRAARQAAP